MVVKIIVATDIEGGIGKNGCLPWKYLKDDMEYFRNTTMGVTDPLKRNIVVMGGRTFRSIPDRFRPLVGRVNFILSSQLSENHPTGGELTVTSPYIFNRIEDLVNNILKYDDNYNIENVFIIGGATIYKQLMVYCNQIYMTVVEESYPCDTHFTFPLDRFTLTSSLVKGKCDFRIYIRKEQNILHGLKD